MNRGDLRVQLSLLFTDEDLFDSYIIPWKEGKELKPLIVKLLSAYFYNDDIRALIEGCDIADLKQETDNEIELTQTFASIRNTVAAMGILASSAQDDLEDGIDYMKEQLNNVAKATGGSGSRDNEFGSMPLQINTQKPISQNEDEEIENTQKATYLEVELEEVKEHLDKHDKVLDNIEGSLTKILSAMSIVAGNTSDVAKTSSESYSNRVPLVKNTYTEEINDSYQDKQSHVENKEPIDSTVVLSPKGDGINLVKEEVVSTETPSVSTLSPIDGAGILAQFMNNGVSFTDFKKE